MEKDIKNILIIHGYDSEIQSNINIPKKLRENFVAQGANVIEVGDGKKEIFLDDIQVGLKKISGSFLLIINCHGGRKVSEFGKLERSLKVMEALQDGLKDTKTEKEQIGAFEKLISGWADNTDSILNLKEYSEEFLGKKLYLGLNKKVRSDLSQIVELTKKTHPNDKINWFMHSCFGGHGHKIIKKDLKANDVFISNGDSNNVVIPDDFSHFCKTLPEAKNHYNNNFSASNLYIDLLVTDYNSLAKSPNIGIPIISFGGKTFDPRDHIIYGRKFTDQEKQTVISRLGKLKTPKELNILMTSLETATNLKSLSKKDNYGAALAVGYVLSK